MRVSLWRDEAHFLRPVTAAGQRHASRSRCFLAFSHDGVTGYGEVSPQPERLNGDPSLDDVIDELRHVTVPQLLGVVDREGDAPSWSRINRFVGPRASSNVAVALVEMALLDRELRAGGTGVRDVWPVSFSTPTQSTVSLLDPPDTWTVLDDAARVRVKTAPGALDAAAVERLGSLRVPMLLDYNCSATSVEEVRAQVEQISAVATLDAVEQPFAAGNVVDHALLARTLDVPISIDEGVRTFRDVQQILRYEAARMICVKPARVAGLANARTLIVRARDAGLAVYLGGFFESAYARFVHRCLSEHCVSEPSDLGTVALVAHGESQELEQSGGGFTVAPAATMLARAEVVGQWN